MIVMKFGGSVLNKKEGFVDMIKIIRNYKTSQLFIVVSALGKVTSLLKNSALIAEKGDTEAALDIIKNIFEFHFQIINELFPDNSVPEFLSSQMRDYQVKLNEIISSISITGDLSARILDSVLCYGEFCSLALVSEYLKSNDFCFEKIDSTEIIVTDDSFGNAKPNIEETDKNIIKKLNPKIKAGHSIVTQGFTAKTKKGDYSTMGIESSNLSAAIFAASLNAGELTIWTNVEGIRSADPFLVDGTKPIKHLNLNSAKIASFRGLKLIYPEMLDYAEKFGFDIVYRSAENPDGDSTVINNSVSESGSFIVSADNLINIQTGYYSNFSGQLLKAEANYFNIFIEKNRIDALISEHNLKNFSSVKLNADNYEKISAISVFNCPDVSALNKTISKIPEELLLKINFNFKTKTLVVYCLSENNALMINILHKNLILEQQ